MSEGVLSFIKAGFLAFIEMLIRWNVKSQNIDVVVAAAENYLGIPDLTLEELQGVLSGGVLSSQAFGMVQEQIVSK